MLACRHFVNETVLAPTQPEWLDEFGDWHLGLFLHQRWMNKQADNLKVEFNTIKQSLNTLMPDNSAGKATTKQLARTLLANSANILFLSLYFFTYSSGYSKLALALPSFPIVNVKAVHSPPV